jgi:translation elongation factor EF-G
MDEVLYQSNKEKKRVARTLEQGQFLEYKKNAPIIKAWEEAQVKAAGIQSALDYYVEQYTEHKDELEKEMQQQIEEKIDERQKDIMEFLMSEKDRYLEAMGIQAD